MAFEVELKTYEENKERFVQESEGQYVVIFGTSVLGRYPTYGAAYDEGVRTYDGKPFLIKQILREEPIIFDSPTGLSTANLHSVWQYSTQFP
jgi:hypothetical protein